jgi:epoxyqueuosine reductase QueG
VASIDRFSHAPQDHHPEDLLPGARSVISIGAVILEGVRRANIKFHHERAPGIYSIPICGSDIAF